MCLRFQVKNLLISVATFGAGIAIATALDTGAAPEPQPSVRSETFLTCVEIEETVPKPHRIDTEREFYLRDQIRVTEKELIDIKTPSAINAPGAERERLARQRQLETRLEQLLSRLNELHKELDRLAAAGTKLIRRQVCHER